MTNQETNVTNAFETTLSSGLSAGATTINVSSTTGAPAVPFYAVLDPADDSKREVVLVDSGKTATTLTLSASSSRGLDGTSDVAHDSGATVAVVPVAALWKDINDRVEGHTHTGGTDGTAIATGDLTGHDKAAHDALGLDHGSLSGLADFTTDHGTEHDAHDHSAAAATIASADLADHNKSTHDALGIDAATLDGLDSTAFAAVAGDTFTGLTTFEDGIEGNLGTDIRAASDSQSLWPTGFSWQVVSGIGGWPTTAGVVQTFNFGDVASTFQVFYDVTTTNEVVAYMRRWGETTNLWRDWVTVTTAENPGLWEVDESTEVAGPVSPTTSFTDMASVTLSIPSDWGSWKCEAYATGTYGQSGGGGPAGKYFKIVIDGTSQQEMIINESDNDTRPWAVGGRRTGMTTTGSRTVSVQHRVAATGEGPRVTDMYLYARAVRTS